MGILTSKLKDNEFLLDYIRASDNNDTEKLTQMNVALQAFIYAPKAEFKKIQSKIQAVGVSTDLPIVTSKSFNVTLETDNFDMGWEQAFKQVPVGANQRTWQIYDVANSLTFRKVDEGGLIEQAGVTGTIATAYVDYYGGAMGWTDAMVRFREVAAMLDIAQIFRNKYWTHKGNIHYALLAAAAALNITTWQGVAADGQLRRDILTINKAVFDLTDGLKDKGYGDMATAPLLMYANPFDQDRIEAAFRAVTSTLGTNAGNTGAATAGNNGLGQEVTRRRIDRIYTYNTSISAGSPIIVLPGQKSQKADVMAPTTYNMGIDPLTLNRGQSVWSIYGAIVADTDQCGQLTLGAITS